MAPDDPEAARDVAIANAMSEVNNASPPGRPYVARFVEALEARGFGVAGLPPTLAPPSDVLEVLRDMHGSSFCSTPLCTGPTFEFGRDSGGVWAGSYCPCGSMDQTFPLTQADVVLVLDHAADALFGRCGECGEVAHPAASAP